MKSNLILFLNIFSLAFLWHPQQAAGGIHVAKSLEWMTVDSPVIIRGVVTDVKTTENLYEQQPLWVVQEVTVEVKETLKGEDRPTLTWRWLNSPYETAEQWMADGHERLFFLALGEKDYYGVDFSNDWVLYPSYPYAPIDLTQVTKAPVASDMTAVTDPQQILDIIKVRLAHQVENKLPVVAKPDINVGFAYYAPNGAIQLEVPENSSAYSVLWSGSACFLIVPADEEYKNSAMQWIQSDDYWQRIEGAQILSAYPDQSTIDALKNLLTDPGTEKVDEYSSERDGVRTYEKFGVREAAYYALSRLGVTTDQPVLEK